MEINGGDPNTSTVRKKRMDWSMKKITKRGSIVELSSGGELFVYERRLGGRPEGRLGWGGNLSGTFTGRTREEQPRLDQFYIDVVGGRSTYICSTVC